MVKRIKDINFFIEKNNVLQLIETAEGVHEAQYAQLISKLTESLTSTHLVCVAGPSSSGKTIFTNRLKHKLEQQGISSLVLSMDNYFYNKENILPDANGNYDFESVHIVDVALFRQQLNSLLSGESVFLPRYNFYTGKKEYDTTATSLPKDGIILVEGIHALNYEAVFGEEWEKGHFGIYIATGDSYETEDGAVIEPHQVRMIRRMVRDAHYRNCNMMKTLHMWDSVRRGEEKWIQPYTVNADFKFNSSLDYELSVMGPFFLEQYSHLNIQEKEQMKAYLDKKILEACIALSAQAVPQVSILNEFIPRTS